MAKRNSAKKNYKFEIHEFGQKPKCEYFSDNNDWQAKHKFERKLGGLLAGSTLILYCRSSKKGKDGKRKWIKIKDASKVGHRQHPTPAETQSLLF